MTNKTTKMKPQTGKNMGLRDLFESRLVMGFAGAGDSVGVADPTGVDITAISMESCAPTASVKASISNLS